ncbi:Uncharacterised protein family UPF0497 [Prunus dulcis]|uniref:CASP-like protein n=1 Tax=Prunus dulcis TaxID=3755 RepID=A0A4Y1RQJ6_PRUDU|nr:Uncharacterised protein family UPF0497 [Prunus dulcis]
MLEKNMEEIGEIKGPFVWRKGPSAVSAQSGSEMKELIGRPGSVSGLLLRIGQFSCASIAISVMVTTDGFATFTAFCYLIASMGLQLLWSLGLACLDIYALWKKRDLQNPILVSLFVVGDWVTATLSLAAASSCAGLTVLFSRDLHFCKGEYHLPCINYKFAVAFAFVTWALLPYLLTLVNVHRFIGPAGMYILLQCTADVRLE